MMKARTILIIISSLMLSSFKFPDEKKFLSRKAANITVYDAKGNSYELFSLIGNKPLIISPVYTKCPSVCGILSNGTKKAVEELGTLGKDFTVVSFSFDSSDTEKNLAAYETRWSMDGVNWKTISASGENIRLLMSSIDFEYDYNSTTKEFDHPSLLVVLTPNARISRYIYGINPRKKDLKIAVMEAAAEKTSPGIFKGFYLKCFAYDPLSKTYKLDWGFIISTFTGLLIIGIVFSIFIRSFIVSKNQDEQ
jgi:protein SCO1/2